MKQYIKALPRGAKYSLAWLSSDQHTAGKRSVAGHGLAKIFIMSEYLNIHHKAWKKDRRNTVLLLKDIVRLCPYKFHKTTTKEIKEQVKNIEV